MRSSGSRTNHPENSQSASEDIALPNVSVEPTAAGASVDVDGILDDDPMCMHTVVCVSSHARRNGSQSLPWIDGKPRYGGISLKHTAWTPRSALRSTSAAASCGSQSWMMINGIRRPFESDRKSVV